MADEPVTSENAAKPRIEAKKKAQQDAAKERVDAINDLRISYKKIKDEPAFQDILKKGKMLADYHLKMAKDGVGYRDTGELDDAGNPRQELIFFDQNKRTSELDKAAGVEEVIAYVEKQAEASETQLKSKKVVS